MKKNRVCRVIALLVLFGAFGAVGAAADEMTVAPAAFITAPTGPFQWTGFYIGGNGGYGWSSSSVTYSPNDAASQAGTCGGVGRGQCIPPGGFQTGGPLAGGQVGYNWQFNPLGVAGIEADYQWANLTGQGLSPFQLGNVGAASANSTMIANQTINSSARCARVQDGSSSNPLLVDLHRRTGVRTCRARIWHCNRRDRAGCRLAAFRMFAWLARPVSPDRRHRRCSAGRSAAARTYALTSNLILRAEVLVF